VTDLISPKKSEVRALCERYHVERLALFGSTLRDDFDFGNSDLDFTVEFQPMTPQEHAEAYFGLLEDLVEIRAIRNPYLRQEIEDTGVRI
jgi:uncharacterized protein